MQILFLYGLSNTSPRWVLTSEFAIDNKLVFAKMHKPSAYMEISKIFLETTKYRW